MTATDTVDPASKVRAVRRDAWTAEAEQRLRALVESGAYTQEVAKALGRSQQSVAHRANKLGLSLRSAPMVRRRAAQA